MNKKIRKILIIIIAILILLVKNVFGYKVTVDEEGKTYTIMCESENDVKNAMVEVQIKNNLPRSRVTYYIKNGTTHEKLSNSAYSRIYSKADEEAEKISSSSQSSSSTSSTASSHSISEITSEANNFIKIGKNGEEKITEQSLQNMSNTIYNILLVLGIIIAVIVGLVLGMKFILGSVEQQADIKKALVPYVIGCIVIFSAFTIWKVTVDLLQSTETAQSSEISIDDTTEEDTSHSGAVGREFDVPEEDTTHSEDGAATTELQQEHGGAVGREFDVPEEETTHSGEGAGRQFDTTEEDTSHSGAVGREF